MVTTPLLALDHIHFSANGRPILHDVSLALQPGEFKVITGPSGCGKSTLLKIAASLLDPQQGEIRLQGRPLSDYSPEAYRKQVSYSFQTPVLFGDTVRDNLLFPYQIRNDPPDMDRIRRGLMQFALPLHTLDQRIEDLSGGERQRVALLRNIQYMPQVLLLDEITSALDNHNRTIVHEVINQLNQQQGIAIIWVTHNSDEITQCDNILTLPRLADDEDEAEQDDSPAQEGTRHE
ncbi:iron ABC transporter ATP-binding protein FetA [Edwardsiella tarda]|uniref:iron efflux ABC transporter ATP-binding subunit FetA n=1 Tax=Edwardsiella tarda TaxID=636 RepID=UPI00196806F9|nr:iron ABC transporter ATP-binding protein FetA [Edwardsiella tarda]